MHKDDKGKIKVRFFEVEVEGGNATLLEAIKNAAAIATRGGSSTRVSGLLQTAQKLDSTQDNGRETGDSTEESSETVNGDSEESTEGKPRKRAYPSPKIVDIDLKSGDKSLEAFCNEKNPSDISKKFLVISYWLQKYRQISAVDIHYIYTGFRQMGWGSVPDMGQPFRDCKRRGLFKSGTNAGTYELTHIGIDAAEKLGTP